MCGRGAGDAGERGCGGMRRGRGRDRARVGGGGARAPLRRVRQRRRGRAGLGGRGAWRARVRGGRGPRVRRGLPGVGAARAARLLRGARRAELPGAGRAGASGQLRPGLSRCRGGGARRVRGRHGGVGAHGGRPACPGLCGLARAAGARPRAAVAAAGGQSRGLTVSWHAQVRAGGVAAGSHYFSRHPVAADLYAAAEQVRLEILRRTRGRVHARSRRRLLLSRGGGGGRPLAERARGVSGPGEARPRVGVPSSGRRRAPQRGGRCWRGRRERGWMGPGWGCASRRKAGCRRAGGAGGWEAWGHVGAGV